MNTHERFSRMYAHQEADRVPMMDGPWDYHHCALDE